MSDSLAILWNVAHQPPLSTGFPRQEYWSGLPFPSPGDLPDPGIETRSPTLQADSLPFESPGMPINRYKHIYKIRGKMFLLGGGEEEIREEFKKKVAFELGLELTC